MVVEQVMGLSAHAADIAAWADHLPDRECAEAADGIAQMMDQLAGLRLSLLHRASLSAPPAVFNAVTHVHETNKVTRRVGSR